jgi:hypothetical protein
MQRLGFDRCNPAQFVMIGARLRLTRKRRDFEASHVNVQLPALCQRLIERIANNNFDRQFFLNLP